MSERERDRARKREREATERSRRMADRPKKKAALLQYVHTHVSLIRADAGLL